MPYSEVHFAGALVMSVILGALLGVERSLSGKHAGMRTYALVSMGSCLFVIIGTLSALELSFFGGLNPLGIASSVVVGIGFLGSGLYMFRGEHPAEITTASGIWVAAGVGMACGFGFYLLAVVSTVMAVVIFSVFLLLENAMRRQFGSEAE